MEGATKWDPVRWNIAEEVKEIYGHEKVHDKQSKTAAMISTLGAELEQARSRIHQLEMERRSSKKKLSFWKNSVKVLVEFRNKDPNHVEWAKALKELYLPALRDYVKSHYPVGHVWSATGKLFVFAPPKAPTSAPMPPPPPPASVFRYPIG